MKKLNVIKLVKNRIGEMKDKLKDITKKANREKKSWKRLSTGKDVESRTQTRTSPSLRGRGQHHNWVF